MPGTTLPPFPDNIPTHPLLIIDYILIEAGDQEEKDRLWKAATELGFWYLKNHGVETEANGMFEMGAETAALPLEEKMKYEQGDDGTSFGYKAPGTTIQDRYGTRDSVEFINVAKDDALSYPIPTHHTYPSTVDARMEGTIRPFVNKSLVVMDAILNVFEEKLGMKEGMLAKLHAREELSNSEARCTRSPPQPSVISPDKAALGEHTDFGSLSFLHNRLGGLQVLPPGLMQWQYVKPIPGHAIMNVGDALTVLTSGILHSNVHRVVPPPGAQSAYERYSIVFFLRPSNPVPLAPLVHESRLIAEAAAKSGGKYSTGVTAAEWLARRVKNRRAKNHKGYESWLAGRGTEYKQAEARDEPA